MQTNLRLTTSMRVAALIRQAGVDGAAGFVRHKGDPSAGAILLKISLCDKSGEGGNSVWKYSLRSQSFDAKGESSWIRPHQAEYLSESDSEAWIARAIARDSDFYGLWKLRRAWGYPQSDRPKYSLKSVCGIAGLPAWGRPRTDLAKNSGAVEKTRTSTGVTPQRPQRCASTNSATTASQEAVCCSTAQ